jgi:sugar O-acyltransferase (sialic acid O-acetyltransferase NeuD family)
MSKVIIFGMTDNGELAHYYLNNDSEHEVVAFTTDKEYLDGKDSFKDLPLVAFEELKDKYPPSEYKLFIAIGYSQVNKVREEKYNEAKAMGYEFVSYISSKATIFDNVKLGDNLFILEDNTVQPFVELGNNIVLWSGNHIGHHSIIKDNCFITSHVVVSGRCVIEKNCFIGVNSTLRDHITIASENVIGAGSLILKDTLEKQVYKLDAKGVPAKFTSDKLKGI